jgi:hypothetical protein
MAEAWSLNDDVFSCTESYIANYFYKEEELAGWDLNAPASPSSFTVLYSTSEDEAEEVMVHAPLVLPDLPTRPALPELPAVPTRPRPNRRIPKKTSPAAM